MHNIHFIAREPILNPKQKLIGYKLFWQKAGAGTNQSADPDSEYLVGFVAEQLNDEDEGWAMGDKLLFLDAPPSFLTSEVLQALPPAHTVLNVSLDDIENADVAANLKLLHAKGFGISVRTGLPGAHKLKTLTGISWIEVELSPDDVATQGKAFFALKPPGANMIARPVANWKDFDECAALGISAYVGPLYLTPRPGNHTRGLNPSQAIILRIMEMIQKNEDIQAIESILKRDAAISYKLLRFINSAAFGLGREIHSLRQALSLLGYTPLYRWLSMLLATASTSGYSPLLMEAAIIRGRLTELLGENNLKKQDADNLFMTGMFSLLDRLLGISMPEVLESIPLSKPIEEALLNRTGAYGSYLALAEACELNSPEVSRLASSLQISPEIVNVAHMSALEWSQNLGM